ncbi:hypothetical protein FNV43_RR04546 [Rhamnella rubrinervis]|uniref:Uncharacterized protein n=1 Tax=Rhamnella rubrinervis TaxID=2594499 RepID=A0A8K0MQ66_9ROSA|nr:hypothetical protein FNV43_RR04546 [Rhamnella rubrinervis]
MASDRQALASMVVMPWLRQEEETPQQGNLAGASAAGDEAIKNYTRIEQPLTLMEELGYACPSNGNLHLTHAPVESSENESLVQQSIGNTLRRRVHLS